MGAVVGRVRDRSSFRALARPAGRAARGPIVVVYTHPDGAGSGPPVQVAYAIGRRHGNAVQRNRLRRRLREAVRVAPPAPPGRYLVRANPSAARLPHADLVRVVGEALQVAGAAGTRSRAVPPVPEPCDRPPDAEGTGG